MHEQLGLIGLHTTVKIKYYIIIIVYSRTEHKILSILKYVSAYIIIEPRYEASKRSKLS